MILPRLPASGAVRWWRVLPAALFALLAAAGPARASFTEQLAIDARAISLANNVTADPPGVMSIHYNPAGLSLLGEGDFVSQGLTVPVIRKSSKFTADPDFRGFDDYFKDDPLAGTQGTTTSARMYFPFLGPVNFLVAPALGFAHREAGSRWTVGFGQYAPIGVGFVHGASGDPARFGGQAVYQQHLIYAAPALSYQLTETLSIGASVGLGQTAMGARLDMRAPGDIIGMTKILGDATKDLEIPLVSELTFRPPWFGGGISPYDKVADVDLNMRDDFSPSYNLGVHWAPRQWFALGFSYQSPVKANLTGHYRLRYSEAFQRMVDWFGSTPTLLVVSGMLGIPNRSVSQQSGVVSANLEFPQMANLGVKLKPVPRLSLLADLHWANWSSVKKDRISFDQKIQLLQFVKVLGYSGGDDTLILQRKMKDSWNWGVGVEYQLLDWLSVRAGYERRKTSINSSYFDLLYALPDLDSYGAGVGIKLKNGMVIDLAAGYIVSRSFRVPNNGSTNLNYSADFTKPVYNPYAGLDYEQKTVTYLGSFKVTMPLETMRQMMHHQAEMLHRIGGKLNPMRWLRASEPGAAAKEGT